MMNRFCNFNIIALIMLLVSVILSFFSLDAFYVYYFRKVVSISWFYPQQSDFSIKKRQQATTSRKQTNIQAYTNAKNGYRMYIWFDIRFCVQRNSNKGVLRLLESQEDFHERLLTSFATTGSRKRWKHMGLIMDKKPTSTNGK